MSPLIRSVGLRRGGSFPKRGPNGTKFYVEVTIPAANLTAGLPGFPVYLRLSDMPAEFWAHAQADGGDIRVTHADGATRVPVDLVGIDAVNKTGELHFKADLSSSVDNVFRVYYGHGSLSQPASTDTYGRAAVWNDYAAVYHLEEDPTGELLDSTGNGHDMTSAGSMTSGDSVAGKLAGKALDFDGSNDHTVTPDHASLDFSSALTMSTWVKPVGVTGTQHLIAKFGDISNNDSYVLRLEGAALYLYLKIAGGFKSVSGGALTAGAWAHVVGTYDGATMRVYVNGAQVNSSAQAGNIANSTSALRLAAPGAVLAGDRLAGLLDEVRLAPTALSAARIAAEYANQNDPSTFLAVGEEQEA